MIMYNRLDMGVICERKKKIEHRVYEATLDVHFYLSLSFESYCGGSQVYYLERVPPS